MFHESNPDVKSTYDINIDTTHAIEQQTYASTMCTYASTHNVYLRKLVSKVGANCYVSARAPVYVCLLVRM